MNKLKHYINFIKKRMILVVVIPWVIYALYLTLLASPRYESSSQLIVKSSSSGAAFDPSSLLLPAVSGVSLNNESLLVQAFIESNDMLNYLDESIEIAQHYSSSEADIFSRLGASYTKEELLEYFRNKITVEVDSTSSIITLQTQAFTPEFAQRINALLVARAESFINEINNQVAEAKLEFAQSEHDIVEKKLQKAKTDLLAFQAKYNVLDPAAEGAAFQQIAFSLESSLAQKKAQLIALKASMSDSAPEVLSLLREIAALETQIVEEKLRITSNEASQLSVSQQMANYSNLQVQLELAIQAYSASLITLEKSRVETYEQLQHLVTVESPTLPEDNTYPKIFYDLALFGVLGFLLFGIVRIVIATIRELD